MVLTPPEHHFSFSDSPRRRTTAFLVSVSSLVALYAKRAGRVSSKLRMSKPSHRQYYCQDDNCRSPGFPRKPPLAKPIKRLLTQISDKAIAFIRHRKRVGEEDDDDDDEVLVRAEDFGDGGVWQKTILMGYKCQPLDFSGVIYYDIHGKQLDEFPTRSPRASPLPGYLARRT